MNRFQIIPKYPSAIVRPVRSTGVYWTPSPAEYGLLQWHSELYDHWSPQIPQKTRKSRIPRLPGELITEIVSHVWDEDSLKACALTAKAFTYQAYKNLFEVVPLCFPNRQTCWDKTPRQLLWLLRESPRIAKLIRRLVVHVGVDYEDDDHDTLCRIRDEETRKNLHRVVALLGNLRSLSFPRFGAYYKNHASVKTTTPFFPRLSDFQIQNLRELDISALTDEQFPPFQTLSAFKNVRNLTMDFMFVGTNLVSNSYWIPPLHSLALFGQFDMEFIARLLLEPNFPLKLEYYNLQVLEVEQRDRFRVYIEESGNPRDLRFLNVLLSIFRNIKEFRFGPCSCTEYSLKTFERFTVYGTLADPPDISPLRFLETLILEGALEAIDSTGRVPRGHIAERYYLAACPTEWMAALFQKVSRPSPLREIELRFQVVFRYTCGEELLKVLFSSWDDLADALLSWRFPHLRRVKISIDLLKLFRTDCTPFRNIDSYPGLKKLKRAGLLEFKFF